MIAAVVKRGKSGTVRVLIVACTHEYIYGKAEVRFIKGRLKFGGSKNSAPFPSMVVIFRPKAAGEIEEEGRDNT